MTAIDLVKDSQTDQILVRYLQEGYTVIGMTRHGETELNQQKKAQGGMSNPSLNDKGSQQAQKLADKTAGMMQQFMKRDLSNQIAKHVYAANLKRHMETAEPLLKALGLTQKDLITDARLRERDLGEAEGSDSPEVREKLDAFIADKNAWDKTFGIKNLETATEVSKRMQGALQEIAKRHPSELVWVITSGKAARIAIATLTKNVPDKQVPSALDNGEVIYLLFKNESSEEKKSDSTSLEKKDSSNDKPFLYIMRERLDGKRELSPLLLRNFQQ